MTPIPKRAPRLGWIAAPPDPRTLKLSAYTTPALPKPPAAVNWLTGTTRWPILGNDRIGDCVPVAAAHLEQEWTGRASGAEVLIPESEVVRVYTALSGYDPTTGANDNGCRSLDALNLWRRNGIGGRRITAYVQLDETDLSQVKTAANLFGGLFVAARLPLAARDQIHAGRPWRVVTGNHGTPGSWGGHALHMGAYDTHGVTFVTWGTTQRATWGWWNRYVVEAYGVLSPDWIQAGGNSPSGFNLDALLQDLHSITT